MSAIDQTATVATVLRGSSRAVRLWGAIREKGTALILIALAIFCCAAIPLYTSTVRTRAEFQIKSLQQEILDKQQQKALLMKEIAEKYKISNLETAGKQAGLGPPVSADVLTIP